MGGPLLKPEMRRAQVGSATRSVGESPLNKVERFNGQQTVTQATFHASTDACGSRGATGARRGTHCRAESG